jgi:hypothetical protein
MKLKNKNTKASVSSEQIADVQRAVGLASKPFATLTRLTPAERKRNLKIRRGGHQVVPVVAELAAKYGVEAPDMSGDALAASFATSQELGALLSNVALLHATVSDAQFNVQGSLWKHTMSLYGMLRNAASGNPDIANELKPVEEWFRRRKSAASTQPAATAPAATAATVSTSAPAHVEVAATAPSTTSASAPAAAASTSTVVPVSTALAAAAVPAAAPTTSASPVVTAPTVATAATVAPAH